MIGSLFQPCINDDVHKVYKPLFLGLAADAPQSHSLSLHCHFPARWATLSKSLAAPEETWKYIALGQVLTCF